ncbi:Symplekin tight junction protein C terminal-domain-containing protein [Gorgonomyces haynaldii]|nr:Symplekin tight junction protein C terminal-domain-containing protein [Gorgonomyces haynaldii]
MDQNTLVQLLQGTITDQSNALEQLKQLLDIDPQQCALLLPIVFGQVVQTDEKLRILLLNFFTRILLKIDVFYDQVRFPVMAGCLEAMCYLLQDESIHVQKQLVQSVTVCLGPILYVFNTTQPQPEHEPYWQLLNALKTRMDGYFDHPNQGVKILAVRCLQKIVQLQSSRLQDDEPGLEDVPMDHPYIQISQLQIECTSVLNRLLAFLANTRLFYCTPTFVCAVMNSVYEIIKTRPQFAYPCIESFLKLDQAQSFLEQIRELALEYGAKSNELQRKRSQVQEDPQKRQKIDNELEADILEALIANLQHLPLDLLVDATVQTMLSYDQHVWDQELKKYLAKQLGQKVDSIEKSFVRDFVPEKIVDVDKIIKEPQQLQPEMIPSRVKSTMDRILQMGQFFEVAQSINNPAKIIANTQDTLVASRFGWMLLTVRVVGRSPFSDNLKQQLIQYCCSDFKSRMDMLLLWLHEESYQDLIAKSGQYEQWTLLSMDLLRNGSQDIPPLEDERLSEMGTNVLKDMIVYRPGARKQALDLLLQFSQSEDDKLRTASVECLMTFVPEHKIASSIVDQALLILKSLELEKLERQTHLFLSCMEKNQQLLQHLFEHYSQMDTLIQEQIQQLVIPKLLVEQVDTILDIIDQFPPGSENLALECLKSLSQKEVSQKVLERTKQLYLSKDLDYRFLSLVVHLFEKQILDHIPKLVNALSNDNEKEISSVFERLVDTREQDEGHALLTAPQLIVWLHQMEDLQRSMECINLLFSIHSIKQEQWAIAIGQMSDQKKLPLLLMRTIIQVCKQFPGIVSFAMKTLMRLIDKRIWKQPKLWDGFILCMTFPSSIGVILSLHPNQGIEVFQRSPQLPPAVEDYTTFTTLG